MYNNVCILAASAAKCNAFVVEQAMATSKNIDHFKDFLTCFLRNLNFRKKSLFSIGRYPCVLLSMHGKCMGNALVKFT